MPTARESAVNRPLSGTELKQLIIADFSRMLDEEGMLSPHIAYGRVGYDLRLRMHLDNLMRRESEITQASRPIAHNIVAPDHPELATIDAAPLADPSPHAAVVGLELERNVTSPNAERVRLGLPIPVETRGQDGTVQQEMVRYPPDASLGDGDVHVDDVSGQARAEWKLPEPTNAPLVTPTNAPPITEMDAKGPGA